ncbi:uncharacterized protein LOC134537235 [Bacillus rossius redtenbacheri]|uniref:uncharacterized protein LOC134537235 n=1 Tax=Bacillus rossius redtenbacheri TaxID=93214 RepID=UPI002FDE50FA
MEVFKSTIPVKMIGAVSEQSKFENVGSEDVDTWEAKPPRRGDHFRVACPGGLRPACPERRLLQGSPGNLSQFEDLLFSSVDIVESTCVIAVKLGGDAKGRVSVQ